MNVWLLRWFVLILLNLLVYGCASDPKTADGIVVAVYSDLDVGRELTSLTATVLDPQGMTAAEHTFRFSTPPNATKENFLVSFGVKRGSSQTMHLRLVGFRAEPGADVTIPVIERTYEAQFLTGKTGLLRAFLGRLCIGKLDCAAGNTCEPTAGECQPVVASSLEAREPGADDTLQWLPSNYDVAGQFVPEGGVSGDASTPDADMDAATPDAGEVSTFFHKECRTGDLSCPPGCTFANDHDCPRPTGESCAQPEQCESAQCVGEYCCDEACSTQHIAPSCAAGTCESGICEADYGDCNHDKGLDGCEESLADNPRHCGACENACLYGVCQGGECPSSWFGSQSKANAVEVEWGVPFGFRIPDVQAGKLAALGMRVAHVNGAHVFMALFEGIADDGVGAQLAQTPELTIVDERVEWVIPELMRPELSVNEHGYWFYFVLSAPTTLYTDLGERDFWRSTGTPEFGPIMDVRFDDEYWTVDEGHVFPNVFLTVVPSGGSGS